jgi:uncharacterized protein (DUF488 family)
MITPRHTPTLRGTIYTLGYAQPDAAAHLDRLMRDPLMCLVDIRSQPRSRPWPQWNRAALSARYSRRYVWERRLGTVHYRDQEQGITLAEGHLEAIREAAVLLCEGTSLVLLCACKDARTCHRSLVAKLIQDALPVPKHGEVRQ